MRIMWIEYACTGILLGLAGWLKSPAFAYASVLSLLANMVREAMEKKFLAMKDLRISIPEDVKKKITDVESRLSTIEFGIKSRGF